MTEVQQVQIGDLIPYANNAKTHPEEQIVKIASSIKEFGFNAPVLIDSNNGIIAGHGRTLAAQKLGMEEVPCVVLDHLSDVQKKAYILADNRLGEIGGSDWDMDLVSLELEALQELDFDVDLTGFDDNFIGICDFDPASEEDQGKLDELDPKWIDCPYCGKEFDLREAG